MVSISTYEPFIPTDGFGANIGVFCQCRNTLLRNRNDINAIGSYVEFLQHYIFSSDYSFSGINRSNSEVFANKRDAALMVIEAIQGIKDNRLLHSVYLSTVAQNLFIAGKWTDSIMTYVEMLNQPGILDASFVNGYNGELEAAAKICHNICFLLSLCGELNMAKVRKDKFKAIFSVEFSHNKSNKSSALLNNLSAKDLTNLDIGRRMEVFFYDGLLDSMHISDGMTMLDAVHNDMLTSNKVYIPRYDFSRTVKYQFDGFYMYDDFDPVTPQAKVVHMGDTSQENQTINSPATVPAITNTSSTGKYDDMTLDDYLNELNSLTGLKTVKSEVASIINLLQLQNARRKSGLSELPVSNHLVFSGNPGTGKTTVARLLAQIYHKLGVLSQGQLIEVDRSGLVGGYVGQTALKTKDVIQQAIGGVLFIDEAYTLSRGNNSNDFGQEAIDTILKAMEDNRNDLIVIVAGYPELMRNFIMSNPGLKSRFNRYITFTDYTPSELLSIFEGMCKKAGCSIDEPTKQWVFEYFQQKYNERDSSFANARDVRNFFENAIMNQANRLANTTYRPEDVTIITLEDVQTM